MPNKVSGFEITDQFVHEVVDFSSQYGPEDSTPYAATNLAGSTQVFPAHCDSPVACAFRTYGRWWQECPSAMQPVIGLPEGYNSEDYIDVFFDRPVVPTRIEVFETYNPGAVVRILACYRTHPVDGPVNARVLKWITLWSRPAPVVQRRSVERSRHTPKNVLKSLTNKPMMNLSIRNTSDSSGECGPAVGETEHRLLLAAPMSQSRIFCPPLEHVPPFPTDLIRLELNSSDCAYFTQFDAVRLTGLVEVNPRWCGPGLLEDTPLSSRLPALTDQSTNLSASAALALFSNLLRPSPSHMDLEQLLADQDVSATQNSQQLVLRSPEFSNTQSSLRWSMMPYFWSSRNQQRRVTEDNPPPTLLALPRLCPGALVPYDRHIIVLPPGTICPTSLFGLTHLDEVARWRHGPLTRLPVEILLNIFSYLDFRSICRVACVSRQFRVLADEALSRLVCLNLQAYWPWLTDHCLSSLGCRLGRVFSPSRPIWFRPRRHNYPVEVTEADEGHLEKPFTCSVPSDSTQPTIELAASTIDEDASPTHEVLSAQDSDCTKRLFFDQEDEFVFVHSASVTSTPTTAMYTGSEQPSPFFPSGRLRRLDMSWCGNYSQISPNAFGHFLVDACRQLTTLRLSSCKFLNDDCLLYLVNACRQLEELDLSSCQGISPNGFLPLGRLIRLRWLSLYRTKVTEAGLYNIAALCQHLQHLNLGSCILVKNMDQVLGELAQTNRRLCSINLWRSTSLTANGINRLVEFCPELEELDVGWCRNITHTEDNAAALNRGCNCITRLALRCRRIKKLFLTATSVLNSSELVFVARCLGPQLEQLDILGSLEVSPSAVATTLNLCENIRLLDCSFCPQIPLMSLVQLRRLFPRCYLISSIRDPYDGMVPRELLQRRLANRENQDVMMWLGQVAPRALIGAPLLLALPAPNPLPAIAGPVLENEP